MEGMPLKLLITAIVIGITLPAVLALWSNVDRVQTENSIVSELGYLSLRIQQVYMAGPSNAIEVDLDLDSGLFTSVQRVDIGDSLEGPWRSTIRWKLSGEGEGVILIEDEIPVCGKDGKTLTLGEGHSSVYLETKKEESGLVFVEVSLQRR